jgi:hypothetical protein
MWVKSKAIPFPKPLLFKTCGDRAGKPMPKPQKSPSKTVLEGLQMGSKQIFKREEGPEIHFLTVRPKTKETEIPFQ